MEGALQIVVGRNLRRVRQELGYSQESFGEHVGWHRTFVGAVERGERNLTLRTIERLAEQLHCDPMDLLWDRDRLGAAPRTGGVPRETEVLDLLTAADGGADADPANRRSRPR